jgi:hypothetical protein
MDCEGLAVFLVLEWRIAGVSSSQVWLCSEFSKRNTFGIRFNAPKKRVHKSLILVSCKSRNRITLGYSQGKYRSKCWFDALELLINVRLNRFCLNRSPPMTYFIVNQIRYFKLKCWFANPIAASK